MAGYPVFFSRKLVIVDVDHSELTSVVLLRPSSVYTSGEKQTRSKTKQYRRINSRKNRRSSVNLTTTATRYK